MDLPQTRDDITVDSTVAELAEEWWQRFQKRNVSPGTLTVYESTLRLHVIRRFGDLRISACRVSVLDARVMKFEEQTGQDSRRLRVLLTHIFDLAVRHDLLPTNPARSIEPPQVRTPHHPRALTAVEWDSVRTAIRVWGEQSRTSPRDSTTLLDVVVMSAATGVRIGEVLALRPCDLRDLDGPLPTVDASGTLTVVPKQGLLRRAPKTSASRRVLVIPAFALPMLRQRVAQAPDAQAPLFPSGRGTWLYPGNIRRQWRAVRDEAGLGWVTPHVFRRTVATLIDEALGKEAAAAQLGHRSSRTTTEHYIARPTLPRDAAAAAAVLDEAFRTPGEASDDV